jgi:hypothetical protein
MYGFHLRISHCLGVGYDRNGVTFNVMTVTLFEENLSTEPKVMG